MSLGSIDEWVADVISRLGDPYKVLPLDKFPCFDMNRELLKPGENEKFPDGALVIRMDDDFWIAAILPLTLRIIDLDFLCQIIWPGIEEKEGYSIHPDHDSRARDELDKHVSYFQRSLQVLADVCTKGTVKSIVSETTPSSHENGVFKLQHTIFTIVMDEGGIEKTYRVPSFEVGVKDLKVGDEVEYYVTESGRIEMIFGINKRLVW